MSRLPSIALVPLLLLIGACKRPLSSEPHQPSWTSPTTGMRMVQIGDKDLGQPLLVGVSEVTRGQWAALWTDHRDEIIHCEAAGEAGCTSHLSWHDLEAPSGCDETCPITSVSWRDATRYANKLSELDGLEPAYTFDPSFVAQPVEGAKGYRLLRNEEWTIVARRNVDEGRKDVEAWHAENTEAPRPVCTREPGPDGVCDLLGNVDELTWDWEPVVAEPRLMTDRAIRGGCYDDALEELSVDEVEYMGAAVHDRTVGFRLAREP